MLNVNQQQTKAIKRTATLSKSVVAKPKITKATSEISVAKKTVPTLEKVAKPPKVEKVAEPAKVEKIAKPAKEKTPKLKMVRDRFTMPKDEYAQLSALKERSINLGQTAKRSELIRAGILLLSAMPDETFKAAISKVTVTKTGKAIN